jgi:uncharacterized protein (TIGR03435 family)
MPKKRRGLMFGYKFTRPCMARKFLLAVLLLCACAAAFAQSPSSQTSPPAPSNPPAVQPSTPFAYEVVSVKPIDTGTVNGSTMYWRSTKDGFSASGVTLEQLVTNAYGLLSSDQIEGLPSWADSAQFAVEARMDESTAAAFQQLARQDRLLQQRQMLQSLLTDRFALKAHHESRERPVYDLVLAKGGSKLQETPAGINGGYSMDNGHLTGHGISIESLTFSITNLVGRFIVDKTGLTGKYDMTLNWTPDEEAGTSGAGDSTAGPSIFTALEEQLGLKLVSAKGPVDTIVIDHVEKPSQN